MVSPPEMFGLEERPIAADDIMTGLSGNRLSPCRYWQFGLIKIRMAELMAAFSFDFRGNG
jgi:hypothetical protein